MGSLSGKVALITGAGRGQGRSHAIRLAQEGAAIVATDICSPIVSVPYPLATRADLDETVASVEQLGGEATAVVADVRDLSALANAVDIALQTFGRLDIVLANAGISPMTIRDHGDAWSDVLDVNLTGTQNTLQAAIPALRDGGAGGSIVITSSGLGLTGIATDSTGALAYVASKHGQIGLMRSYAGLLAKYSIRVNCVLPGGIGTPMVVNDALQEFISVTGAFDGRRPQLPIDRLEEIDVSNAIVWLVSDAGRYITGVPLPVDAGLLNW